MWSTRCARRREGRAARSTCSATARAGCCRAGRCRFWPDTRKLVRRRRGPRPLEPRDDRLRGALPWVLPAGVLAAGERIGHFDDALNSRCGDVRGCRLHGRLQPHRRGRDAELRRHGQLVAPPGKGRIANVAVQDTARPTYPTTSRWGATEPVGYALAVDAFTHRGPAKACRIGSRHVHAAVPAGRQPRDVRDQLRRLPRRGRKRGGHVAVRLGRAAAEAVHALELRAGLRDASLNAPRGVSHPKVFNRPAAAIHP